MRRYWRGRARTKKAKRGIQRGRRTALWSDREQQRCISLIFIIIEEVLFQFYVLFDAAVDAVVIFDHLVL